MKIRTDYVSNSSSSSFIIGHSQFMEHFHIGKNVLINTIKALLPESEHKYFKVYDMTKKSDVKALEKIAGSLKSFSCNNSYIDKKTGLLTGGNMGYETWEKFYDSFVHLYDIYNWGDWTDDKDYYQYIWKYDRTGKCIETKKVRPQKWMITAIKNVRKKCGVLSNWEAAHRSETRFVIHFDSNVICSLKGFTDYGQMDDLETPLGNRKTLTKEQKEKNKQIRESKWETESYTLDRLCEIIMTYWAENKIIDVNDSIFKEAFVDDGFAKYANCYPALHWDTVSFCEHEG